MEQQFNIIGLAQENLARLLDGLGIDQINRIPQGFNNNLIWNFGHIISALQMLCYGRAGLPLRLDENFVHTYKVGTKPSAFITMEEYGQIKQLAAEGLAKLKEDYRNNHFSTFKPYTTSTGIAINTIDYAIHYVALHHGMHQGYSTALKKLVA